MKTLGLIATLILLTSNAFATNISGGFVATEIVKNTNNASAYADMYWINFIAAVSTTTTAIFNPSAGVVLILSNGEGALNLNSTEVKEAIEKNNLELELSELDLTIIEQLEKLQLQN